jgi:transcriptional regulator with XRE-family HTH domain
MAKPGKSSGARLPSGDVEFGRNLRFLRRHFGFTQEALGKEVGVTKGAISQYEKGLNLPNFETLKKLGVCLGCGVDAMLFGPANRFRQTNLPGTTIDERVAGLAEAYREYVLHHLRTAEEAAKKTPGEFLRAPEGESWDAFNDYLAELAYGRRKEQE